MTSWILLLMIFPKSPELTVSPLVAINIFDCLKIHLNHDYIPLTDTHKLLIHLLTTEYNAISIHHSVIFCLSCTHVPLCLLIVFLDVSRNFFQLINPGGIDNHFKHSILLFESFIIRFH